MRDPCQPVAFFLLPVAQPMFGRDVASAVAFGGTMFASSALNNLFVTYYIVYFTSVVRLTSTAFFFGQFIFMYVTV